MVTTLALALGTLVLAVWLAVAVGFAIRQACHTWKKNDTRPVHQIAMLGSLLPVAAIGGPLGFVGAVALIVPAVGAVVVVAGSRERAVTTAAVALLIGTSAAAPVIVAREFGAIAAFVLLLSTFVYDASAYVVGSGTVHRWEGVAAGLASIASTTLGVAAVLVPPFRGLSPWILGVVAAVATPMGPVVATMVLGRAEATVPAVRRLDSLVVTGPAWALAAAVFLP